MKKLLLSVALFAGISSANAQLPDGSIAPNFTLTDIDGNVQDLYTYLDAGMTVVIDVSATWCGPCWNYHNTGALESLWVNHGPTGGPGVSASTTNDVIVLFIEGDGSTNSADLNGTGSNTQGDWVTGVEHPIIDPAASAVNAFNNDYAIGYFPTIYMICPNRIITEVGQQSASALYASVGDCPAPASAPADAAALTFDSETVVCGSGNYTPIVTIQNNGTSPMTSATITVMSGASVVSTGTYTGNLATYGIAQVTCTPIVGYAGGTLDVIVTTTGDADAANGTISQVVASAAQAVGITATVNIITDAYGSETTWNIKNSSGTTVASGGPYNDLASAGTTTQTPVNVNLVASMCYTFNIFDSYGDGIDSGYGVGSFNVKDGAGNTLVSGGDFTDEDNGAFKAGVAGIEEIAIEGFNVYPNPATSVINVAFEATNADYTVTLVDIQGRVISTNVYSNLAGAQIIELPVNEVAKGNYLVKVVSNGTMSVENVVIN